MSRTGQNGEVIALTEPQVWTVIGVLAATLASFVAASLSMIIRTVNVQALATRVWGGNHP